MTSSHHAPFHENVGHCVSVEEEVGVVKNEMLETLRVEFQNDIRGGVLVEFQHLGRVRTRVRKCFSLLSKVVELLVQGLAGGLLLPIGRNYGQVVHQVGQVVQGNAFYCGRTASLAFFQLLRFQI